MKIFVLISVLTWLSSGAFATPLSSVESALFQDSTDSRFDVLEKKYEEAMPLKKEEALGEYLGRCFRSNDNDPLGMIMSTRKFTTQSTQNVGPLFPAGPSTIWKSTFMLKYYPRLGAVTAASRNDSMTLAQINAFWSKTYAELPALKEIDGTLTTIDKSFKTEARKGDDGYFYVRITQEDLIVQCYFYKKMF